MVSIINNKAKNINVPTSVPIAGRISDFPEEHYPLPKSVSMKGGLGLFLAFYYSLGEKGKYALFILFVLLTSLAKAQNINTPNKYGPLGTQVNTLTGNYFMERNDIYIPARGIDIDVSFSYNTFNYKQNRGYGNGWSFSYGMSYSVDSLGDVIIVWGDNRSDFYTLNSGGTFTPEPGIFDNLTQYQTGKYLLQTKFGIKYYFDNSSHKRLTKMQEPNGNVLNFAYADSLVTSISNTAGQTITLTYNGAFLTTIVDAITTPTHTFSYSYDGYGNLIQVLDPLGNKNTYQYLVNGPMSETTDKNGNTADIIYYPNFTVSELISCDGRKSFSYDTISRTTVITDYVPTSTNQTTTYKYATYSTGKITKSWLAHITGNCCGYNMDFVYDNLGNLLSRTDANGNIYTYTYDNVGNLLTITDPLGNKSSYTYSSDYNQVKTYTDANGGVYSINYDNAGNPTQVNEPGNMQSTAAYSASGEIISSTDKKGYTYHYAYDAYGYPTQFTQPLNTSIGFSFDARGNMISGTDPNGNVATLQYDKLNRPTILTDPYNHTEKVTYDANGNITSFTDQNGHTATFSYDAADRLVATTDAVGQTRQYGYDAMNNIVQYKDPAGKTTTYSYDNLNRLTGVTDALGNGFNFSYDNNGNPLSAVYPNGSTANYMYDKLNRPISGSDGIGQLGVITYDKIGNLVSYTNGTGATISASYDALNRLVKLVDPLGNSRTFTYDNNDNLISSTDRNGHSVSYTYDSLSRKIAFTDNNNNITKLTRDPNGNITSVKDANNNTTAYTFDALQRVTHTTFPDGSTINWGYDNGYNITSKKLTDGSTISYQYDAINRLVSKTLPGNNVFSYQYNLKGRLLGATNVAGTVSITYDDIDRPISETLNGHTTTYAYNMAARTQSVVYPDGSSLTLKFDTRNRLSNIAKGNTNLATYQYNNADQYQQLTYGNGVITNWQYDNANRLTNLTTAASNLPNLAFSYDKEMNKTAVSRSNFPQASEHYNYDGGYRLTGFTQGTLQNTYAYDAVGNRTTANLNTVNNTYTTNNLNQYTALSGSQSFNPTYDGNGNLTYDGLFYKRYDAEGHLVADSNSSSKQLYQYDALGRRIQKTVNGNPINYYYSGFSQLEQRNGTNDTVLNETIYSAGLTPLMIGVNNNSYYYHQNDQNSVEAISNNNGTLVERYQYDAYGKPSIYDSLGNAVPVSLVGNRFAFTGQEYDAQTSSYHFHYRNYSPTLGKFYQRDPIGYNDRMDMYQYVGDNPANKMDVLGLSPCPPGSTTTSTDTPGDEVIFWGGQWSNGGSILQVFQSNTVRSTVTEVLSVGGNIANHTVVGAVLAPINAINTAAPALDLYNNGGKNTVGQNMDDVFNVASSGATTYVGLYGLTAYGAGALTAAVAPAGAVTAAGLEGGGAISATLALAPEAVAAAPVLAGSVVVAGGLGIYGGADAIWHATTGEHFYETGQNGDVPLFTSTVEKFSSGEYFFLTPPQGDQEDIRHMGDPRWQAARDKVNRMGEHHSQTRDFAPKSNCPPNGNNGNQNPNPPGPNNPGNPFSTNNINSQDPNEIIGPTGVGTPQFVNDVAPMPYTINFENSVNASAPAKTVRINYPIDPKQDMNNISLGSFGFNSLTFNIPANTAAYYQRLDARDSLGLYVDITAGLDVNNHQIFWVFQSIDPVTLLTPTDPLKGFLLLTDTSKPTSGHGFVNFFIKPSSSDVTGDTTHAVASIVFDGNDTVPTNVAKNTIDAGAPTSHMNALPSNSASTVVPLSWTATDDAKGSGVKSYSLYVAVNGGAFSLYATNISRKDTTFTGASGNSYSFFVLGTDSVGNTETLKPGAEATTYINMIALPVTWLYFNAVSQGKDGFLTWATATETNTKSFEVERSIDSRNFTAIGSVTAAGNSNAQSNYNYTDVDVVSLNIPVVYYRLKQIDKDGRSTYSNIVAVQLPIINVGPIVQAYPNPFKQTLNIMIANMTALDLSDNISIYTLEGKIVYEKPIGQRLLNTTITLTDLPQLTPGMYILKLGLNKQTYSFKLMKQ